MVAYYKKKNIKYISVWICNFNIQKHLTTQHTDVKILIILHVYLSLKGFLPLLCKIAEYEVYILKKKPQKALEVTLYYCTHEG